MLKSHPLPPIDLNERFLPIKKMRGPWVRFYWAHKNALFFNKNNAYRFNAPNGEFGVLYLGEDEKAAFIETYGWLTGERYITREQLTQRPLALVSASRPMNLVDLTGKGLAQIGADGRLCIGDDYKISQNWSFALWGHPGKPDGILYRSRHDPDKKAVALFDRPEVKSVLSFKNMGILSDYDNVEFLVKLFDYYNFILIP